MSDVPTGRCAGFRAAIERFLQERLDAKLDKIAPDHPKREELIAQYQFETWIEDAARRVAQIQSVTHSLKATHPDARGSNLYRPPSTLPSHEEVGSQSLGNDFASDVVGNAAALDVYKFLTVEFEGRPLLAWMLEGDIDLGKAMAPNSEKSRA